MKRPLSSSVLLVIVGACAPEPAKPPSAVGTPAVSASAPPSAPSDAAAAPPPSARAAAEPDASPPPPLTKVQRSGKTWPFHAWNHAEAVTFNQFAMRPGAPPVVFDDARGWSPHLVDRKPLNETQGKKAVDLVLATNGDVEVSKCPFPRHAVVLYDDALPLASINLCFSCGDIMLWPHWEPEPDWSKMTAAQQKERERRHAKQMTLYEKVFPKWKLFFRDDVGFPIDASYGLEH